MPPPRRRQRNVGPSLTAPEGVFDGNAQVRLIRELQESVERLWRQTQVKAESQPAPSISDADLLRAVEAASGTSSASTGTGLKLGTADPEDIAAVADNGTATDAAPMDHVHAGIPPCATVEALPAIPDDGVLFVFWTSVGAGVGDDQVWMAHADDTAFTPCQKSTTLSGTP